MGDVGHVREIIEPTRQTLLVVSLWPHDTRMATILAPAVPLFEPVWSRQDAENDQEWHAFQSYLLSRSKAQCSAATGYPYDAIELTAVRWSWHTRTQAWDRSVVAHGHQQAREAFTAAAVRASSSAAQIIADGLELTQIEIGKQLKLAIDSKNIPLLDKMSDLQRAVATVLGAIAAYTQLQAQLPASVESQRTPLDYTKLSAEQMKLIDEAQKLMRAARGV